MLKNSPDLWLNKLPKLSADSNKYSRGYALVCAGEMTGASILASRAAQRIGAGYVVLLSPENVKEIYAVALPSVVIKDFESTENFAKFIVAEKRIDAVLIGCGFGVGELCRENVLAILQSGINCVLDADALTSFEGRAEELFVAIKGSDSDVVLTPHDGEFERLFKFSPNNDRFFAALTAAKESGAAILLKGEKTIIATVNGEAVINENAPPSLATAGSGDVLAGMIVGLVAGGMDIYDAACAATFIHGECGNLAGRGLIAEDLVAEIPEVIKGF